jgi:hypothetical protein
LWLVVFLLVWAGIIHRIKKPWTFTVTAKIIHRNSNWSTNWSQLMFHLELGPTNFVGHLMWIIYALMHQVDLILFSNKKEGRHLTIGIYRVHLYYEIKRFLVRISVFIVKGKFICKCDVSEWSCLWHLSCLFGLLFTVRLYFYSTLISYHSISIVCYFISFFIFSQHSLDINSEVDGHKLKETLIAYCKWFAMHLQVCDRDFRNGIYDYSYSNSSNIHHSLNCEQFTKEKKHIWTHCFYIVEMRIRYVQLLVWFILWHVGFSLVWVGIIHGMKELWIFTVTAKIIHRCPELVGQTQTEALINPS